MPDRKNIVQNASPSLIHKPNVQFIKSDFDAFIEQHGYDVIWEKSVRCPCKTKTGSHRAGCQNCLGYGWLYINAVQTKMLIQNMNTETKYKSWSEEKMGMCSISAFSENQLSIYDRITLMNDTSILSELRDIRESSGGILFVFPSYRPVSIFEIYRFVDVNQQLVRIPEAEYTLSNFTIRFTANSGVTKGSIVSIRYRYQTQYHITDIPKEVRGGNMVNTKGQTEREKYPVHATATRAHESLDYPDFSEVNVFDNSYIE